MEDWKTVNLTDLIGNNGILIDGDWIESKDQDPNGDVRLIQLADVGDGRYINKSSRFLTNTKAKELRCTFLQPNDILIARMPDPLGRACIFPGSKMPCVTVVDVCILRPDSKIVDVNWLLRMINSPDFRQQLNKFILGTTRQRISRKNLEKIHFPLPPLAEQKRIAAVLDKADAVREKRRRALNRLDALLQSVFLDMFGDPVSNPKGWETSTVGKYAKLQGGYAFKSNDYVTDSNVKLVKISNVHYEKLTWDDIDLLPESFLSKYSDFSLKNGDIVVSLTRPIIKSLDSVKVAQITNEDLPCLLNQRVGRFIIKNSDILSDVFLLYFCYSKHFKIEVAKYCSESLQPNVSNKQIEDIKMILPPISLQLNFEEIAKKIKSSIKTSKENLLTSEKLFQSLQQRAFASELFGAELSKTVENIN